jgi:hypothetical protein
MQLMPDKKFVGFPDLNHSNEFPATRPMSLDELPRLARIEREMAVITAHHERIAKAIQMFWGHRDCVEYIQQLILSGGDGVGKARIGFKREVVAALMRLIELHEVQQR